MEIQDAHEMSSINVEYLAKIAMVCHEANKAYCDSIGDPSQKHWNEAAKWQRESAVKGVAFRISNPAGKPDAQHKSWYDDKVANGWAYGPVKDEVKKTHPSLLPYDELPLKERKKDALFQAIVDALA